MRADIETSFASEIKPIIYHKFISPLSPHLPHPLAIVVLAVGVVRLLVALATLSLNKYHIQI